MVGATSKSDAERNEIRSQERSCVAIMSNDEKRNVICHRERTWLAMGKEIPALCYVFAPMETKINEITAAAYRAAPLG